MIRFLAVAVMLLVTALFQKAHRRVEFIPQHEKLESFPSRVGAWTGHDRVLDPEVVQMLGPDGDFLTRTYTSDPAGPWIDLYIAYFRTQHRGDSIHSPKNCLPGSGWTFLQSSRVTLDAPGQPPVKAGRYIIANGTARQLVLYWYQAHGRTLDNEYTGKFYLLTDAIRLNRTDGALVRIMTPMFPSEDAKTAEGRIRSFALDIVPVLPRYIPN
jgi:EpsI family protein